MPDQVDLDIYQGDDYAALVTVTDPAGAPADLTPFEAAAHIRKGPAHSYPVVIEIAVTVAADAITLYIPSAQTATLYGKYVWDLELISADSVITTIAHGYVNVSNQVTRLTAAEFQILVEEAKAKSHAGV